MYHDEPDLEQCLFDRVSRCGWPIVEVATIDYCPGYVQLQYEYPNTLGRRMGSYVVRPEEAATVITNTVDFDQLGPALGKISLPNPLPPLIMPTGLTVAVKHKTRTVLEAQSLLAEAMARGQAELHSDLRPLEPLYRPDPEVSDEHLNFLTKALQPLVTCEVGWYRKAARSYLCFYPKDGSLVDEAYVTINVAATTSTFGYIRTDKHMRVLPSPLTTEIDSIRSLCHLLADPKTARRLKSFLNHNLLPNL